MLWALGAYIGILLLLSYFYSRRQTLADYFTNAGKTSLPLMVATNVATFIGAGFFIMVGEVYRSGISFGLIQIVWSILGCLAFALVAPKIKQALTNTATYSLPDFLGVRYGDRARLGMTAIQCGLLIIWLTIQTVALAQLTSFILHIPYWQGLLLGAGICLAYSSMGGLKLNVITDTFQFLVMLAGMGLVVAFGLHAAGGMDKILATLPATHFDPFAFSNPAAVIIGSIASSVAAFCNSAHWQRISSARSLKEVSPSYIFSMPFTVFFVVCGIICGLAAAVIMPGVVEAKSDTIFFNFSQAILPPWGAGIVAAAILSTIMSSVDSLLVALSTVIIRQRQAFYPAAAPLTITQSRLVTLAIATAIFVVSFVYPHLMSLGMLVYNLGLGLIPAIFAALYNRPRMNVMLALRWGVLLTALLYPLWDKNTFLATLPVCAVIALWPMGNKTSSKEYITAIRLARQKAIAEKKRDQHLKICSQYSELAADQVPPPSLKQDLIADIELDALKWIKSGYDIIHSKRVDYPFETIDYPLFQMGSEIFLKGMWLCQHTAARDIRHDTYIKIDERNNINQKLRILGHNLIALIDKNLEIPEHQKNAEIARFLNTMKGIIKDSYYPLNKKAPKQGEEKDDWAAARYPNRFYNDKEGTAISDFIKSYPRLVFIQQLFKDAKIAIETQWDLTKDRMKRIQEE